MNNKLFHLGNHVVALSKKFERTFPPSVLTGGNELGQCFKDLLDLINQVRIAAYTGEEEDKEKKKYSVDIVQCTEDEMNILHEKLQEIGINYYWREIKDRK